MTKRRATKHVRIEGHITMLYMTASIDENGPKFESKVDGGYFIQNESITCLRCGMTSHNPNDVSLKYCAHCKRYHEDPLELPAPKEAG